MLAFGLSLRVLCVEVSEVADVSFRPLFELGGKEHLISRVLPIGAHSLGFSLASGGLP